uniref:Bromodomain and PHD finger containing, 3a n=1 Tax=Petromyzon marinus TaxID=7757 RepID=S4RQK8_PETMA
RLKKIVSRVTMQRKKEFMTRLQSYWTLKRQSRNGVPLLRRLQSHLQSQRSAEQRENDEKNSALKEQLKYWQRLRQDLERARLLIELIRKREKLKREQIKVQQAVLEMQLTPFLVLLRRSLEQLQERDTNNIFAEPVSIEEVPDYLDYIKKPMDFSGMRARLEAHGYCTLDDFENDFDLIVANCMQYNSKDTIFYKAAVRLRDQGGAILRQARRQAEKIGFDYATGMHLPTAPLLIEPPVLKWEEVDNLLLAENRVHMSLEEQLRELLEKLDLTTSMRLGGARSRRAKLLRKEINVVRRKMSTHHEGTRRGSSGSGGGAQQRSNGELCSPVTRTRANGVGEEAASTAAATTPPAIGADGNKATVRDWKLDPVRLRLRRAPSPQTQRLRSPRPCRTSAGAPQCSSLASAEGARGEAPAVQAGTRTPTRARTAPKAGRERETPPPTPPPMPFPPPPTRERTELHPHVEIRGSGNVASTGVVPSTGLSNGYENGSDGEEPRSNHSEMHRLSCGSDSDSGSSFNSSDHSSGSEKKNGQGKRGHGPDDGTIENGDLPAFSDPEAQCGRGKKGLGKSTDVDTPMEPLDLVWAKCRGYPSYPALIIDPKIPREGFYHNSVPIPLPPMDVLTLGEAMAAEAGESLFLVLFFDNKRTWQWLPRSKLMPLGIEESLDKLKMMEGRKSNIRKSVQIAYDRAMTHRSRVQGENSDSSDVE